MATTSSRSITVVSDQSAPPRAQLGLHFALRFIMSATNEFWVASGHVAAQKILNTHPGADVLTARINSIPNYQEDAGFISGSASVSQGSYVIADVDYSLSDEIAARFANRQALKGKTIVLYETDDAGEFTEDTRRRTSLGLTYKDAEGAITISFEGIYSLLRKKVMEKKQWRLASTVTDATGDTMIWPIEIDPSITDPINDILLPVFRHSDLYSLHPNRAVGYLMTSEGELVAYEGEKLVRTDTGGYGLKIIDRELLGTSARGIVVQPDTLADNKPVLTEFPYMEERTSSALRGFLTGVCDENRSLPEHWCEQLPYNRIDFESLTGLADGGDADVLYIADFDAAQSKEFIEEHVLKDIPAVLVEDRYGRFSLRQRSLPKADAIAVVKLDRSNVNISQSLVLEHNVNHLYNPVIVKRGWDPIAKNFILGDVIFNERTKNTYGELSSKTYEIKTWNSVVGTSSQLTQRLNMLRDLHHAETKFISLETLPGFDVADVGDIVEIDLPNVVDSSTGLTSGQPLKQSFVAIVKDSNAESRTVSYGLFATQELAQRQADTDEDHYLTDAEYRRIAPTALSDIAPSTLTGGIRRFTGQHAVDPDKWYRIDENAVLAADFQLTANNRGQFIGIAFQQDLRVESNDAAIDGTALSVYTGTAQAGGNPGYIGRTTGSGSVTAKLKVKLGFGINALSGSSGPAPRARNPVINSLSSWALTVEKGKLAGIPARLAGSGGGPAGSVSGVRTNIVQLNDDDEGVDSQETYVAPATPGGHGGLSALFLGPRLSRTITGRYARVNGGPGTASSVLDASRFPNVHSGPAAPGSPGIVAFIVDGNNLPPTIDGDGVHAFVGDSPSTAIRAPNASSLPLEGSVVRSFYEPTEATNRWQSHSAVMYVPKPSELQARPAMNAFDDLADRDFDGRVVLHLLEGNDLVFPQNADINDIAAYRTQLDNRGLPANQVDVWVLTPTGWERTDPEDVIAGFKIAQYRDRGSTTLWVRDTRPVAGEYEIGDSWYDRQTGRFWVLGATVGDDTLLKEGLVTGIAGVDLLLDPTGMLYLAGNETLWFGQDMDEPLLGEQRGAGQALPPGQTTDVYTVLNGGNVDYVQNGTTTTWVIDGEALRSDGATGPDHAVAYYGSDEGFHPADVDRRCFVFARTDVAGKILTIQQHGDPSAAGTPALQISQPITFTGGGYAWLEMGTFGPYHGQLQLRTDRRGIEVRAICLLAIDSVSIPQETHAFIAPPNLNEVIIPYWPINVTTDRTRPIAGSPPPFIVGEEGENGRPGIRIEYDPGYKPNIVVERFPFAALPGTAYQMKVRMRNVLTSGFTVPSSMGAAIQFEVYDKFKQRLLTTDVLYPPVGAGHWMAENRDKFIDLTRIVEIPATMTNVAWGAFKFFTYGDADGHCLVSDRSLKQLAYRKLGYVANERSYPEVFQGPVPGVTRELTHWRVATHGRKGMKVDWSYGGYIKVDFVDPDVVGQNLLGQTVTANWPKVEIYLELGYVNGFDNAIVADTGSGELDFRERQGGVVNSLKYVKERFLIGNSYYPVIHVDDTFLKFDMTASIVAPHDFTTATIRLIAQNDALNQVTDLHFSKENNVLIYGDSLESGFN